MDKRVIKKTIWSIKKTLWPLLILTWACQGAAASCLSDERGSIISCEGTFGDYIVQNCRFCTNWECRETKPCVDCSANITIHDFAWKTVVTNRPMEVRSQLSGTFHYLVTEADFGGTLGKYTYTVSCANATSGIVYAYGFADADFTLVGADPDNPAPGPATTISAPASEGGAAGGISADLLAATRESDESILSYGPKAIAGIMRSVGKAVSSPAQWIESDVVPYLGAQLWSLLRGFFLLFLLVELIVTVVSRAQSRSIFDFLGIWFSWNWGLFMRLWVVLMQLAGITVSLLGALATALANPTALAAAGIGAAFSWASGGGGAALGSVRDELQFAWHRLWGK